MYYLKQLSNVNEEIIIKSKTFLGKGARMPKVVLLRSRILRYVGGVTKSLAFLFIETNHFFYLAVKYVFGEQHYRK